MILISCAKSSNSEKDVNIKEKDNVVTEQMLETTINGYYKIHPQEDKKYKKELTEIARKNIIPKYDSGKNTIYIKVNKKTHNGIAFVTNYDRDASGWDYLWIYSTKDSGKTWELTNRGEQLCVGRGSNSYYMNDNDEIFVIDCCDKAESVRGLIVSKNLGKTFEVHSLDMIWNNRDVPVRGEILPTHREDILTIAWYPIFSYVDTSSVLIGIDQISTSDYKFKKSLYKNDELKNIAYNYGNEKWKDKWLYQVALKSKKECFTKEEIDNIQGFQQIYSYNNIYQLLINYIYAIHGYDYSGTQYDEYFKKFSWYLNIKKKSVSDSDFSESEIANIDLLQGMIKEETVFGK